MKNNSLLFFHISLFLLLATNSVNAQIYINEFLASNGTGLTDEAGDFEDWIEIYNGGNSDVNLGGYYISDDLAEPLLWPIPTGGDPALTTVPAGGYLILWADKDTDDGPNHVDLKLGASGEAIILTQPDGVTIVDQISFGVQTEDVSFGRETDGSTNFIFFPTPSPGAENSADGIPTYTVTLAVPLASGFDDAEESPQGFINLSSSDIEMTEDQGSTLTAGFRFANINLPDDAVISRAYLQFVAEEIQIGPANLAIHGEASGNAAPFQTSNNNITSRARTSSSASWLPAPWFMVGESGTNQQSSDLSELVTEMIAHPDWEEGNAMAFIVSGSGTRTAYSYEQNPERAAKLIIEAEIPLSLDPIPTVYINEVAANSSTYTDEGGTKEDWVEIYNPNPQAVDLGGLFLTDNFSDLDKWQIPPGTTIPANGYLVFFTDNDEEDGPLHTNFSLKAGGEEVALSQLLGSGLTIVDSLSYEEMPFMATYGRAADGGNSLVLFGEVTPAASNNGADLYLSSPTFSVASGSYSGTQSVTINSAEPGTTIFYTLDGSYPTNNSNFYNGPIEISETSSLRAINRKDGYADSRPGDATYLINENKNLPILYLTTDPDNFFDDEIGIYVDGTNGVVAYCATQPVNWARDWERPINLKMFLPDGTLAFDVNAGAEINGACSRNYAMKSLGINLREKEYGDEAIEYDLFPERDHQNYQRLKLRNSGQDFIRLGFRDMVNQNMITGKLDIDLQAGRPSLLYINGEFWGIHNIREKFVGEYFEAVYDVNENDLDILKSPGLPYGEVKKGSDAIYNALYQVVESSNMSNDADWDYFESQVDVNEMMNYWITMTYMNNYDWPANNLTVWRERKEGAKWRYGMTDTDGSTQNNLVSDLVNPEYNKFEKINQPNISNWPNHSNSTLFLRKALDRTEFRDEFIQRSCSVAELVYNEDRVNSFIDETVGLFEPNIQAHLDRWSFDNALGGSLFNWNRWIDLYRDFYQRRPEFWREHLDEFYNLDGYYQLTVSFDANSGGDVFVNSNSMDLPYNYLGTYFKNIPLRLTAVAKPGYVFRFWLETGDTNPEIDFIGNADVTLTPVFELFDCNEIVPNTACNDGDVCTTDDVYDTDCNCAGVFADADQDGVCDVEDQCPGADDTIDLNGNGIPDGCDENCTDGDGDLICADEDCDDNNPNIPATPGTACNDNNPQTTNDLILPDGCTCAGTVIPPTGNYCASESDFPWHDFISNVQLNTLNNTSGKSKYSDFTNLSTELNAGSTYDLSLQTSYSYTTYDGYYKVWIDYNQDGVFSEISETAFSGILDAPPFGTPSATLQRSIEIPTGVSYGSTRMRIAMKRGAVPTPCETFGFGEVEDYTVNIINNGPVLSLDCPADQTLTTAIGATTAVATWVIPAPTTSCPTGTTTILQTEGLASGENFPIGNNIISYEATDDCGNIETCSFIINIESQATSLTVNCPANQIISTLPRATATVATWAIPSPVTNCPTGTTSLNQIAGSAPGSTFQIGVHTISYEAIDDCGNVETCSFTITINDGGPIGNGYCESSASAPWEDWIGNVSLNNLNNSSGKSKYSDFTSLVASADIGGSYQISIQPTFSYFHFTEYIQVWIDFNQNESFADPGELVMASVYTNGINGTSANPVIQNITIPTGASAGNTRMRVSMNRTQAAGPCDFFEFGEVEDYTVNLINNGPVLTLNCASDINISAGVGATAGIITWAEPEVGTTCPTGVPNLLKVSGPANGSTQSLGTYAIVYEVSDDCGNMETCSFTVTLSSDPASLSLDCPANQNLTATAGSTTTIANWNTPIVSTTCPGNNVTIDQIAGLPAGAAFPIGTTMVTYEAIDDCGNIETCSFTITVSDGGPVGNGYCTSAASAPWEEWIGNVNLSDLDNPSGKDGYGDFTALTANIIKGETYILSVQPIFSYTHFTEYIQVWIDFNGNENLNDPGELVISTVYENGIDGTPAPPITGDISIPGNALTGTTRMRVTMSRDVTLGPCESFTTGEVEDYTVNIELAPLTATVNSKVNIPVVETKNEEERLRAFPNPAHSQVTLRSPLLLEHSANLLVTNSLGQIVHQKQYEATDDQRIILEVGNYPNGIYLVRFQADKRKALYTRLFIKSQ